jgi:hypothetical protein
MTPREELMAKLRKAIPPKPQPKPELVVSERVVVRDVETAVAPGDRNAHTRGSRSDAPKPTQWCGDLRGLKH